MTHRPLTVAPPCPIVGIIGGIGSGKSAVAQWVAERAPVLRIDADRLGHAVLARPDVREELVAAFGLEILADDGTISRPALASKVFGNGETQRAAKERLEAIVHPAMERALDEVLATLPAGVHAVLLDAALLLEAGWDRRCAAVVYIETSDEVRRSRILQERGWTTEQLAAREASQWPPAEKRRRATHVVTNDGPLERAGTALAEIVAAVVRQQPK